jgi:hypothetical protein
MGNSQLPTPTKRVGTIVETFNDMLSTEFSKALLYQDSVANN